MNGYQLSCAAAFLFPIFAGVVLSIAIAKYAEGTRRKKRLNKRWEMFAEMDARARQSAQQIQQQQQQKPKEVAVLLPKDLLSDLESADRTDENMKEAVSPRDGMILRNGRERAQPTLDPVRWRQVAAQTMGSSLAQQQQLQNQNLANQLANQQMINTSGTGTIRFRFQ